MVHERIKFIFVFIVDCTLLLLFMYVVAEYLHLTMCFRAAAGALVSQVKKSTY